MNGAQSLVATLTDSGVSVCFANPGTSEMHFVAALDSGPEMRGVLCLFEGVATGAADGYGRLAGGPAATLLHLGPGLANGLANLHNARRARTPIVNVVGDHATYHKRFDAPLESDIDALAGTVSAWVRRDDPVVWDRWRIRAAWQDFAEFATAHIRGELGWHVRLVPRPARPHRLGRRCRRRRGGGRTGETGARQ